MKSLLFISMFLGVLKANAQNIIISFAGSGGSTLVNSVKVENLMAGTSLILNGGDLLRLTGTVGVNELKNAESSDFVIYPNPMDEYTILQISSPESGNAVISVLDLTGKIITQVSTFMDNYIQEFRLSGLNHGFYHISVKGSNFLYSAKLICTGQGGGNVRIEKMINDQVKSDKTLKTYSKGELATIEMNYTIGDRLKFTGISGIYSNVVTDIPSSDKTITFKFIACTDGDNNNYPVVEIGNQIWMAENLKTSKYSDNTSIMFVSTSNGWSWIQIDTKAYGWYADNLNNKDIYGALYTWAAAMNGAVGRNTVPSGVQGACPAGWHLPSDAEWTILTDYLTNNGYGYDGNGEYIAKSLAANTNWQVGLAEGNPGIDKASNNSTGFSAIPGGYHSDPFMFHYIDNRSYFWSATQYETIPDYSWNRNLGYNYNFVGRSAFQKKNALSVRCLKD